MTNAFIRASAARKVGPDYDWTFTTTYKGTLCTASGDTEAPLHEGLVTETEEKIDLDRLRRPEAMLFFDEVVLFEDELADNGVSFLSVKVVCSRAEKRALSRNSIFSIV